MYVFLHCLVCCYAYALSLSRVLCVKYLLYGPLLGKVLYTRTQEGSFKGDWCLHILIICIARALLHQLWNSFVNMLFLTRTRRINRQGYDFKQIDKEWDWYKLLLTRSHLCF
jgi:hypothetical protein